MKKRRQCDISRRIATAVRKASNEVESVMNEQYNASNAPESLYSSQTRLKELLKIMPRKDQGIVVKLIETLARLDRAYGDLEGAFYDVEMYADEFDTYESEESWKEDRKNVKKTSLRKCIHQKRV